MAEPRLPLTVDYALWKSVAAAVRPEYADSYLSRAVQVGNTLLPYTTIAYDRLKRERAVMEILDDLGLKLTKPLHVGHRDRADSQ